MNYYYPLELSPAINYNAFSFVGAWHDPSFSLSVNSQTYIKNLRITWSPTSAPEFLDNAPLYQGFWHSLTTPDLPVIPINALTDGIGEVGQKYYIGEIINELGNVTIPPIAKITFSPVAGESIEQVTTVYPNRNTKTPQGTFRWKYKTVAHYDTWSAFTDVWRTGLREYRSDNNSGLPDRVYNYCFMRNVGLINFWYGNFQPDGSIAGTQFWAYQY